MADLDSGLRALAHDFADAVARVVKAATLEAVAEVLAECANVESSSAKAQSDTGSHEAGDERATTDERLGPAPRREPATSSEEDRVLFYLRARPGERSETVRAALGLEREDMQNAIQLLLSRGKISKEGERRGVRYWPA